MSGILDERDIRTAYQLILGRDADPQGLAYYGAQAGEHGLTLADLRRELFQSAEFQRSRAPQRRVVPMGDLFVVVDPEEPEFGRHIASQESWEPHIVSQITRRLRPGDTYVDVGANVGIMSFHAAQAVGPSGKVIAFEPNADNVQNFLHGVRVNKFANIVLLPFAASDAHLIFSLQGSSNTHLVTAEDSSAFLTQGFPADRFLAAEPRVDFIKIDIEGHEPQALKGLAATIARHRPTVLMEYNPRCLRDHIGENPATFARRLFDLFKSVEIAEHNGRETRVLSADQLLSIWSERNQKAVADAWLPDGMLHFDLILR